MSQIKLMIWKNFIFNSLNSSINITNILENKFVYKEQKIKILDFGAGSGTNTITLSNYGDVYVYEKDKDTQNYLKEQKTISKEF